MEQPLSDIEEYIQFGTPPGTDQDCSFLEGLIAVLSPPPRRLMDLACGVGRHAIRLAQRGLAVTGVDISPERIAYATTEARRLRTGNCRFIVSDIRHVQIAPKVDLAYSFFNTLSLFVDNDELIQTLQNVRTCLAPEGWLVVQLGSLWGYIAEGKFANGTYERTDNRGKLTRKVTGLTRIARTNNVYQHNRLVQYTKDGIEYPTRSLPLTQRIFSTNEWDLLCRLTGFKIHSTYTRTDMSSKVGSDEVYDGSDHDLILVLRRSPDATCPVANS